MSASLFHKNKNSWIDISEECIIGRGRGNIVIKNDVALSGQHCRIVSDKGYYFVEDMQSKNGVKVSSMAIPPSHPHVLTDGDEIIVGNQEFIFYEDINKERQELISKRHRIVTGDVAPDETEGMEKIIVSADNLRGLLYRLGILVASLKEEAVNQEKLFADLRKLAPTQSDLDTSTVFDLTVQKNKASVQRVIELLEEEMETLKKIRK